MPFFYRIFRKCRIGENTFFLKEFLEICGRANRLRPAVASEAVGPVCLWSKWQLSSESPPWEAMFARLPASYRTERPTTDAQVPWDGTVAMASMGKVSAGMLGASGQKLEKCITL